MKKYWLYLEPFTFIFKGDNKYLIYNSLNGKMALFSDPTSLNYISKLDEQYSGYCIVITEQELNDLVLKNLINDIRNIFAGDLTECNSDISPFIFRPILNLLDNSIVDEDLQNNYYFEENLLEYLHEFTIHIETECNQNCKYCSTYYRQFLCCTKLNKDDRLPINKYKEIFFQLATVGVKNINIVISKIDDYNFIERLCKNSILKDMTFRFYINYKNISQELLDGISSISNATLHCIVNDEDTIDENSSIFRRKMPIEWSFIISSESTLEKTILSIDKYDLDADLLPFYNGENIAFFKKNVYTNIEDLNTNIVNKQQIFSRQVINENMFGKLTLLPNGDLYANVNKACLGNVLHKSLNEIIYKEKNMKDAWFMTRSQTPCKQCVYCLLCPSVSNYELVLGKFDLCSIREGYLEK